MRGLILTGPTGVGKSTAQTILQKQHGFWVPGTCTTRPLEPGEADLFQFTEAQFLQDVRHGKVVLPAWFSGHWYGWRCEDFRALQRDNGEAVLNVRPYTALILQAALDQFVGVWLDLDDRELVRRRQGRLAQRDLDETLRMRRQIQDDEDLVYRHCFAHSITADEGLISRLLELAHQ